MYRIYLSILSRDARESALGLLEEMTPATVAAVPAIAPPCSLRPVSSLTCAASDSERPAVQRRIESTCEEVSGKVHVAEQV